MEREQEHEAIGDKTPCVGGGEPLICVPVVEQDAQSVIREITYLSQSTADMIEWRVDAFRDFTDYNAIPERI